MLWLTTAGGLFKGGMRKQTTSHWEVRMCETRLNEESRWVDSLISEMPLQIKTFCSITLLHSVTSCQRLVCIHHPSLQPSRRHNFQSCRQNLCAVRLFAVSLALVLILLALFFPPLTAVKIFAEKHENTPCIKLSIERTRQRCTLIERSRFTSLHLINISGDYWHIAGGKKRKRRWEGTLTRESFYLEDTMKLQLDHFKDIAWSVSSQ